MLIRGTPDIRESDVTPENVYRERRRFMRDAALAGAGAAVQASPLAATVRLEPGRRLVETDAGNPYSTDEEKTPREKIVSYNNFYEFGTDKRDPSRNSDRFKPLPWKLAVAGECNQPGEYELEDFIAPHKLEERIYRLRCVEAWSMVIPWVGVPAAEVLKRFEPNSNARYVAFTTVYRPDEMPGLKRPILDWPYKEGLRLDEAMNPLTLFAVGLYGEILPAQNGAPIRLVVPWKYGFKSIKSIVRIEFTRDEPPTSWNEASPHEYGFYSNVNPEVDHPRWSQRKERRIGDFFKRETLMFNGYGEQVAQLYTGMNLAKHF